MLFAKTTELNDAKAQAMELVVTALKVRYGDVYHRVKDIVLIPKTEKNIDHVHMTVSLRVHVQGQWYEIITEINLRRDTWNEPRTWVNQEREWGVVEKQFELTKGTDKKPFLVVIPSQVKQGLVLVKPSSYNSRCPGWIGTNQYHRAKINQGWNAESWLKGAEEGAIRELELGGLPKS